MINILLAGVGGQGTVLAAKILAQAAEDKGWQVRTAETIGMAQRGGSVTSHVRMGNEGEAVYAPLIVPGTAQTIIAFEPGEALRALPYLSPASPNATVITASSVLQPVTSALADTPYRSEDVLRQLQERLSQTGARLIAVPDRELLEEVGSPRALNIVLLASAVKAGCVPLSRGELATYVAQTVKPRFIAMNLAAIDAVFSKNC